MPNNTSDETAAHRAEQRRRSRPRRHPTLQRMAGPRRVDALDGLRALCALGVVGYHMGFPWLSGGLLGVTILFVLSGYLVTDSILNEYARSGGSFDIGGFYLRRIRRLMPQAVVLVVVTAALCALFNRVLLTKMRPDVIPSLLMYLNWAKILSNVSYFEAAGAPSPLTHFWSLAIEWQFYLVWPLLLFLLMRLRAPKYGVRRGLLVLAVVSAVLMAVLYTPGEDPSRPYYGTDTRAMSLLIGCWLAFVMPMRDERTVTLAQGEQRIVVEGVGVASVIALILLMIFTEGYSAFSYYGGVALVTLLSAAAIGALLPEGSLVSRVLSLPPLVWLGKRSYALYLWHYPLVLLLANRSATGATPVWLYLLQLCLSLVAAELSYRFVERPCAAPGALSSALKHFVDEVRERGAAEAARSHAVVLIPTCIICVLALVGLLVLPPEYAAGVQADTPAREEAVQRFETIEVYEVVIIGDSVPLDAYNNLAAAFPAALIDCKISRQMSVGIELLRDYINQGCVGQHVVICLGSNGAVNNSQLDELLALVGNDRTLWLVNNRMPDDWQDANNELFANFAANHAQVNLIDWYGASEGHDEWFWEDKEHPTPDGAAAYAQLISDALGSVGQTTSTVVVPIEQTGQADESDTSDQSEGTDASSASYAEDASSESN